MTLLWGLPIPFVFRTVSTFWCARRVLAVCMSACHGHPGPPDSVPFFLTHDYVRLFSRSLHYRARLYFHFRSPERSIPARTGLSTQPPGHTHMSAALGHLVRLSRASRGRVGVLGAVREGTANYCNDFQTASGSALFPASK